MSPGLSRCVFCLSPFKKCLNQNYHSSETVEMKRLWKLWWPPWVVCSNDYVGNCFGKVNACTLGFFHACPKKTHQPGPPVCPRPGDQLRTLASWGDTELLPICDLYFSTWTSVQFFLWTSKILAWSLGCLSLLSLRKQSSSFQQLNDCSRPGVLSSTPLIWWFDGRLHFLSRCADFSRPNEKTSTLYWREERLGRVQRTVCRPRKEACLAGRQGFKFPRSMNGWLQPGIKPYTFCWWYQLIRKTYRCGFYLTALANVYIFQFWGSFIRRREKNIGIFWWETSVKYEVHYYSKFWKLLTIPSFYLLFFYPFVFSFS